MYGLINQKNKLIGIHQELRVVKKYKKDYYESHKEKLYIVKIKKKNMKKYIDYEDLYLVRYGNIYIQSKYLFIEEMDCENLIDDLYLAYDVIIRIIEFNENESDCKKLGKALSIIDKEIEKLKNYVPAIEELETRESDIKIYREKMEDN